MKKRIFLITGGLILLLIIVTVILLIVQEKNSPPSDDAVARYLEAKTKYSEGDWADAAALLAPLEKKEPTLYQGRLLLAKSQFFLDHHQAAYATLEKLLKEFPLYHEAGLWMARTELQLGRVEEARGRLEELLSYNADDPRLLYNLGTIFEYMEDPKTALDYYNRAALYEEEMAKCRISLGKLYFRLRFDKKALDELDRALLLLPPDSLMVAPTRSIRNTVRERLTAEGEYDEG